MLQFQVLSAEKGRSRTSSVWLRFKAHIHQLNISLFPGARVPLLASRCHLSTKWRNQTTSGGLMFVTQWRSWSGPDLNGAYLASAPGDPAVAGVVEPVVTGSGAMFVTLHEAVDGSPI